MLNKRLQAVQKLVPVRCEKILDVGTEHALLPISLIQKGKIDYAIASDIAEKPLKKAKENVERFSLSSNIEIRLGYGLEVLQPDEKLPDVIVIAGLGGRNIIDILSKKVNYWHSYAKLVLQPMNAYLELRRYLLKWDYGFLDEMLVEDNNYIYQVILTGPDGADSKEYNELMLEIGPKNISRGGKKLEQYLQQEITRIEAIFENLKNAKREKGKRRCEYLKKRYRQYQEVLQNVMDQ